MARPKQPIPSGFHTVTPYLTVRDAAAAIDFYKKALGAEEIMRMPTPDGKIGHAELKIGDSIIFWQTSSPRWATSLRKLSVVPPEACTFTSKTLTSRSSGQPTLAQP